MLAASLQKKKRIGVLVPSFCEQCKYKNQSSSQSVLKRKKNSRVNPLWPIGMFPHVHDTSTTVIVRLGECPVKYDTHFESQQSSTAQGSDYVETYLAKTHFIPILTKPQAENFSTESPPTESKLGRNIARLFQRLDEQISLAYECIQSTDEIRLHTVIESDCIIMLHSRGICARSTWEGLMRRNMIFGVSFCKIIKVTINVDRSYLVVLVEESFEKMAIKPRSRSCFTVAFSKENQPRKRQSRYCCEINAGTMPLARLYKGNLLGIMELPSSVADISCELLSNIHKDTSWTVGALEKVNNTLMKMSLVGKIKRIDCDIS